MQMYFLCVLDKSVCIIANSHITIFNFNKYPMLVYCSVLWQKCLRSSNNLFFCTFWLHPRCPWDVFFCGLTRRNGGRVCLLRKRRADSLGMQQAGLHRWKQSLPHCHHRCTSPLQAVDCHRLAQREPLLTQPCICSTHIKHNGGKCTFKFVSTKFNPQSSPITDINAVISPKKGF